MSGNLSKARGLLWAIAMVLACSAFLEYSGVQTLESYRAMGVVLDTSAGWFFIVVDLVLAGLAVHAALAIDKGDKDLARKVFFAVALASGVFLVAFHQGLALLLNGGLLAAALWGRMLVSREGRALI